MNNSQAIFHPACCELGYLIDELADNMQIVVSVFFLFEQVVCPRGETDLIEFDSLRRRRAHSSMPESA